MSYSGINTFDDNGNINGTSIITFGKAGGTAKFNYTADQSVNDVLSTSGRPNFIFKLMFVI